MELSGENIIFHGIYTNFVIDHEAPNGYCLEDKGREETIVLNKITPIFVLQDPGSWKQIEGEELAERSYGLFELYKRNGEVVFVKEKYTP